MQWLRLYYTVLDSVKVRTMSVGAQLDYFLLLCCAAEYRARTGANDGRTGLTPQKAAFRARRDALHATVQEMEQNGLVKLDSVGRIVLLDWERYQFASDDAAARSRKTREKKKVRGAGNGAATVRATKRRVRDSDSEGSSVLLRKTAADAAAMTKEQVWSVGREMLAAQGVGPKTAGSYLGHIIKQHGEETVLDALRVAIVETPADLRGWIKARCQHVPSSAKAKQQARAAVMAEMMGGQDGGSDGERDITPDARRVA